MSLSLLAGIGNSVIGCSAARPSLLCTMASVPCVSAGASSQLLHGSNLPSLPMEHGTAFASVMMGLPKAGATGHVHRGKAVKDSAGFWLLMMALPLQQAGTCAVSLL